MRLQNNAKIDLPAGMVPEGVEVGGLNVDIDSILINNLPVQHQSRRGIRSRGCFPLGDNPRDEWSQLEHVGYFSNACNQGARYRDVDEPVFLSGHGSMSLKRRASSSRAPAHRDAQRRIETWPGGLVGRYLIGFDHRLAGRRTGYGGCRSRGQQLVIANDTGGAHHEFEFQLLWLSSKSQLTMLDEVAAVPVISHYAVPTR